MGLLDLLSWLIPAIGGGGFFVFPGLDSPAMHQWFENQIPERTSMMIDYWMYKAFGLQFIDDAFGTDIKGTMFASSTADVDRLIDETVKHYPDPQMSAAGGFIPYGDSTLDVGNFRGGSLPSFIVAPSEGLPKTKVLPTATPGPAVGVAVANTLTNSFCQPIMCQPANQTPLGQGKDTNAVEDLFTAWDYLKRPVTVYTLATLLYTLRLKIWKEGEDYESE